MNDALKFFFIITISPIGNCVASTYESFDACERRLSSNENLRSYQKIGVYGRLNTAIKSHDIHAIKKELTILPKRLNELLYGLEADPNNKFADPREYAATPLSMIIDNNNATILHKIIKAEKKNNTLDLEKSLPIEVGSLEQKGMTPIQYAVDRLKIVALQELLHHKVKYLVAGQLACKQYEEICEKLTSKPLETYRCKFDSLLEILIIFNLHANQLGDPQVCPERLFAKGKEITAMVRTKDENEKCIIL